MHTRLTKAVTDEPLMIDIHEVSRLSSLSRGTIRRLADEGLFPAGTKYGRAVNSARRWLRSEIIAFLERGAFRAETGGAPHGS